MSEDIFGGHNVEDTTGTQYVEVKDAPNHPTCTRQLVPYNRIIWLKMSTVPRLKTPSVKMQLKFKKEKKKTQLLQCAKQAY